MIAFWSLLYVDLFTLQGKVTTAPRSNAPPSTPAYTQAAADFQPRM
jgi:hypothetical protein